MISAYPLRLLSIGIVMTAFSIPAQSADVKNAITPEAAGKFFADICYNLYLEDVGSAQVAAQKKGFKYDAERRLFIHKRKDQQMRINNERCALRFLTKIPLPDLLSRFADAAVKRAKRFPPNKEGVHIGTEDAGNGLTRAGAKLDL